MAAGDDPAALWSNHADDDADALFPAGNGGNPFRQHLANVRVGRQDNRVGRRHGLSLGNGRG